MLSQDERNAIDAYLSVCGINLAALLRAEQMGYNLDNLRFEIINNLSESSQNYLLGLPMIFMLKTGDSNSSISH